MCHLSKLETSQEIKFMFNLVKNVAKTKPNLHDLHSDFSEGDLQLDNFQRFTPVNQSKRNFIVLQNVAPRSNIPKEGSFVKDFKPTLV